MEWKVEFCLIEVIRWPALIFTSVLPNLRVRSSSRRISSDWARTGHYIIQPVQSLMETSS